MFCPQCGQQQPSEAVRFCKRCGMSLDRLAKFVERNGELNVGEVTEGRGLTPRQRGTRVGLLVMVSGLLFGGIAALLTAIKNDLFVLLPLAALVFTVGVMRLLYGLLLEGDAPRRKDASAAPGGEPRPPIERRRTAARLPHARAVPVPTPATSRADTSDMAAPRGSVTEQTTRLLEEE